MAQPSSLQRCQRALVEDLDARGFAVIGELLTARDCRTIASFYPDDANFRSRVVMARHGFGRGEYKYFSYPLPSLIEDLRTEFYPWLANVANRWNEAMKIDERYPNDHAAYLKDCLAAGQTCPTPLLLQYGPGDFNFHQDLYGERVFPLQVAVLLSLPGEDFTGGEFVLTEQRIASPCVMAWRHGVSEMLTGRRHTLGIIFHDAR